ncbi:hypothetical protein BH23VER1_BH23VER1_22410 [soil metagenome]
MAPTLWAGGSGVFCDPATTSTPTPCVSAHARQIEALTFEETQEMAEAGAKVLNATAVEFAKEKNIAIYARSTASPPPGTGAAPEGGTVVRRHAPRPPGTVTGVAHENRVLVIQATDPGQADALLGALDQLGICGKQLNLQRFGEPSDSISLVVSGQNVPSPDALARSLTDRLADGVRVVRDLGAVSIVGAGINRSYHNLLAGNAALEGSGITPSGTSTSSFRITWLVPSQSVDSAARALHQHFLSEPHV